ncbi:hypothetical protein GGU10DRAFT_85622 [Lentinula aff. detonsa]|uniref:RRM domain-containing protein n=1 Tax=Lentinula aff. detonsa TaxID=2804958 RepID=A0AA38NLI9_9AGAR|nr:hypothetical protein GGU10DRAFT_85622 [Lentinula aff. detonsa]
MMARDLVQYDYPPGLGYISNGAAGIESQRSTYLPVDRRGSASFSIYDGFEVPNRHNPGGSATLPSLGVMPSSNSPSYHHQRHAGPSPPPNNTISSAITRSTLLWGDLEPWMDEEYAKQVCAIMGWDPINIKIPQTAPDATTGQLANNPGYCFLTFPSQAHAASVLTGLSGNPSITMPNSTKPFAMSWAAMVPSLIPASAPATTFGTHGPSMAPQPYSKEYSIFVGDLAPETSNSDLVAVFRNPVLGLRNDREPKFIRPFLSCKSAKIMLDPVTGVSRGYGFVRFTDETDQQRALIEMHGLYCLSRPMRISPATAKFKAGPMGPQDVAQLQQFANVNSLPPGFVDPVTIAVPVPQNSVSAPVATSTQPNSPINMTASATSSGSASSLAATASTSSLGTVSTDTGSSASLATTAGSSDSGTVLAKLYDSNSAKPMVSSSITAPFAQEVPRLPMDYNPVIGSTSAGQYLINEESWKHHTQARAILGNLIGPNGEQLTSTDPYNTTVFVGGLSPLIQEETLRTFFAPFGDIHYVKVPVGKHCGFVQFVRKADAERAIEKMQGFPIGGSRIRLSWGRSQYKAAQAAAQAAQAAAMQSQAGSQALYNVPMQMPSSLPLDNVSSSSSGHLTQEQAIQLLQKLGQQGYMDQPLSLTSTNGVVYSNSANTAQAVASTGNAHALEQMFMNPSPTTALYSEEKLRSAHLSSREDLVGASSYNAYFDLQTFSAQQQEHQRVQHGQQSIQQSSVASLLHHTQAGQHAQYSQDASSCSAPGRSSVSFSPFSPDPNALYVPQRSGFLDANRRETYGPTTHGEPGDAGASVTNKSTSSSTRPSSASRYASFQGLMPRSGSGSTGTSPTNRITIPIPISRPLSGQPTSVSGVDPFEMHDLNGTLASLDLGDASSRVVDHRPWGVKSPASSSDSGASVQFQMTREDITSA